jgi:hypothetical protein
VAAEVAAPAAEAVAEPVAEIQLGADDEDELPAPKVARKKTAKKKGVRTPAEDDGE